MVLPEHITSRIKALNSIRVDTLPVSGSSRPSAAQPEIVLVIAKNDEVHFVTQSLPPNQQADLPECNIARPEAGAKHVEHLFDLKIGASKPRIVPAMIINTEFAGELRACASIMGVLSRLNRRPALMVNIGTSATTKKGVELGDVVVANAVSRYIENCRVEDEGDFFKFVPRPEPLLNPSSDIIDWVNHPTSCPDKGNWKARWRRRCQEVASEQHFPWTERDCLHVARIASGPFLLDSVNLRQRILADDGSLHCLDMESGGCCFAWEAMPAHLRPTRMMVIRGISDKGDGTKKDTDAGQVVAAQTLAPDVARRVSMRRALALLLNMLESDLADSLVPPR